MVVSALAFVGAMAGAGARGAAGRRTLGQPPIMARALAVLAGSRFWYALAPLDPGGRALAYGRAGQLVRRRGSRCSGRWPASAR
jgi:hypothetical protein